VIAQGPRGEPGDLGDGQDVSAHSSRPPRNAAR
jgi:hypothetical protein